MSISDLNIQTTLLDLGYNPTSNKTSIIFANVIDGVFFGFGSTIQNGLINEAKKQNLPKHFKFPYYSLVEKSIIDFLGQVGGKKSLMKLMQSYHAKQKLLDPLRIFLMNFQREKSYKEFKIFPGMNMPYFYGKTKNFEINY